MARVLSGGFAHKQHLASADEVGVRFVVAAQIRDLRDCTQGEAHEGVVAAGLRPLKRSERLYSQGAVKQV